MNMHIVNVVVIALLAVASLLCGVVGWALPAGLFGFAAGLRGVTVYIAEVRE